MLDTMKHCKNIFINYVKLSAKIRNKLNKVFRKMKAIMIVLWYNKLGTAKKVYSH